MKTNFFIIAILFFNFTIGFSQQSGSVNLSIEENEDTPESPLLVVNVEVGSTLSDGVFIDLPPLIKPAVKSVKLNGNDLWLINSSDTVDKDNVVGWFIQDDGIVIHYKEGLSGDLLVQIVYDQTEFNKIEQIQVSTQGIIRSDQKIDIENSVQSQTNILNTLKSQPDEN